MSEIRNEVHGLFGKYFSEGYHKAVMAFGESGNVAWLFF